MSVQKTVTIIGGGIAGLSTAVFLAEKNFKVTILEASPKLGGRAYSFFDIEKKQFFDNGQHILAGWYKNTFEYLKITGSLSKLNFQKGLEVNFINTEKKIYKLKCPAFSAPLNLILGLMRFDAFGLKDKVCLKNIFRLLKNGDDYESKFSNVRHLLDELNQTKAVIKYFWEPFLLAVFNTRPENISVKIFLNVLKIGFGSDGNSALVIPEVNLNELLINDAVKYFDEKGVRAETGREVKQILICGRRVEGILVGDNYRVRSDLYVSAVPCYGFKRLFDEEIYYQNDFKSELLKNSSIVSVHIFFENEIPDEMLPGNSFGMTGLIGTVTQWIFKRNKNHLSLVISGADDLQITNMAHEDIFKLSMNDLNKTIAGFSDMKISDYKVIKEKRATFIPDIASNGFRPGQRTKYENLFLAGDWTDTGLPATIEGAVSSAKLCSELISNL